MAVELIAKIKPKTSGGGAGEFPMLEDIDLEGGFQIRADITDRNTIFPLNRKEGMLVYTIADQTTWRLLGDLLTWVATEQVVSLECPYLHVSQFEAGGVRPAGLLLMDAADNSLDLPVDGNTLVLWDGVAAPETFTYRAAASLAFEIQLGATVVDTLSNTAGSINTYSTKYVAAKVTDLVRPHLNAATRGHAVVVSRLATTVGTVGTNRMWGVVNAASNARFIDYDAAPHYSGETTTALPSIDPGINQFGTFEDFPINGSARIVISAPQIYIFSRRFPDAASLWASLVGASPLNVKREIFPASLFAPAGSLSTITLSFVPDTTPQYLDLRELYRNGVMNPHMSSGVPAVAGEWRIIGTTLQIFDPLSTVPASGDQYTVRYPIV
jgi:hypothetical protein